MRIELKGEYDPVKFQLRLAIFKEGVKVNSFNHEILEDLTYRSPSSNPFKGPEMAIKEACMEISHMMKYETEELNDVSVEEMMEAFQPIIKDYRIKVWDGQYLPFQ